MGFGVGIAGTGHSALAHGSFHASYLRYDRWGAYLSVEANGRLQSFTSSNSLQNVRGYSISACYNLFPMREYKVLLKAGLTKNFGQMIGDYVGTLVSHNSNGTSVETKQFRKYEYESYGLLIGAELVPSGRSRCWSFSPSINFNEHTYFVIAMRCNIGAL